MVPWWASFKNWITDTLLPSCFSIINFEEMFGTAAISAVNDGEGKRIPSRYSSFHSLPTLPHLTLNPLFMWVWSALPAMWVQSSMLMFFIIVWWMCSTSDGQGALACIGLDMGVDQKLRSLQYTPYFQHPGLLRRLFWNSNSNAENHTEAQEWQQRFPHKKLYRLFSLET